MVECVHVFFTSQDAQNAASQKSKPHLGPRGMPWVAWPKDRQLGTNLPLPEVIGIGYSRGLVESKAIGVDATWSAVKVTLPIAGRRYQDSYGRLPTQQD